MSNLYARRQRKQIVEHLGGVCAKCGFSDPRALQIDHINGGGHEKRMEGQYWFILYRDVLADVNRERYQLLCANCNWIKRFERREHNQHSRKESLSGHPRSI
jgi:RNase P subunit RPR2